jgi:hypothetical protein
MRKFQVQSFKFQVLGLAIILNCQLSVIHSQEPAVRSRSYLQDKFRTGSKPTQQDYRDWMESYVHKTEDLAGDTPFDGNRPITTEGFPALTPGGQTITEFLNNLFYAGRRPTAGLSASVPVFEKMAAGAEMSVTLNYTVGRPAGCPAITLLGIDGFAMSVPAVAEGGTATGTANRPLPRNVDKTFVLTVQAGQFAATAQATVAWRYARYWGALDKNTGITDADILSLTGAGVGAGRELNETRQKIYNGINGAGKYLVFVFPASAGEPSFFINGLNSTAFTRVRNGAFTNAPGATYNVQVWVSNTPQNSPITQFEIR